MLYKLSSSPYLIYRKRISKEFKDYSCASWLYCWVRNCLVNGSPYKTLGIIPLSHTIQTNELNAQQPNVYTSFGRDLLYIPQGSVLALILFNLYISDLPTTISRKIIYTDYTILSTQNNKFEISEETFNKDLIIISEYLHRW